MTITKAELQKKYDALSAQYETISQAHGDLLNKIIWHAGEAAAVHDLCTEVEATFESAGIDVPDLEVTLIESVERRFKIGAIEAHRLGLYDKTMSPNEKRDSIIDAEKWSGLNAVEETRGQVTLRIDSDPFADVK